MNTDEEIRKMKNQCPSVCISGLKQTGSREEKGLAGFDPDGHSGYHIQSELVNPI
jgi:hypothetical protein